MKKLTVFVLICTLLFGASLGAPAAAEEPYVRVRLSTGGAQAAQVLCEGAYRCGGTSFTGGSVTLERHGARVRVVHETLGVLSDNAFVYLARRGEGCLTLENARYGACRYLGDLYACVEDGALCLVNYVPLTQYLYGVTGGELRNSHPAEALKAQAIAAKGYALSCLGGDGPYDLTDGPNDQVYKGYRPDDGRVMAAVDAVAGRTLLIDGEPLKCYYCTGNGGQTLTPAMRWGADSPANAAYDMRFDPYDLVGAGGDAAVLALPSDASAWPAQAQAVFLSAAREQEPRAAQVLELLALSGYHNAEDRQGTALHPADEAPHAWAAAEVRVRLTDGSEAAVRCGFAPEALLEAGAVACEGANVWFVREEAPGQWQAVFSRASGHRVGMSHRGMLEMAYQGYTAAEILAFYYPHATLSGTETGADAQRAAAAAQPTPTPYQVRVIEAPQSAAAQPASASLWDLLLGWLA